MKKSQENALRISVYVYQMRVFQHKREGCYSQVKHNSPTTQQYLSIYETNIRVNRIHMRSKKTEKLALKSGIGNKL